MNTPTDTATGGLRNGDPAHGHQATIGRTLKDSKPWWRPQTRPPQGAPNVIVVLLDDLGFSDFGCFGGEIRTPHIDALAAGGLRYTGYTTVPMCTPARAALFTGKNPHSVGCGWLTHNNPGYPGYQAGEMSQDAPTMAELLRSAGYGTYAVGKWHNVADYNATSAGDRSAWPLQRGFDRFYGFLGAETNFFSPGHIIEGNEFLPIDEHPESYYSTDDWTDHAIRYLRGHRSAAPDKPFFLYVAHNAPHVPLQARDEDIARYNGVYDAGWDTIRAQRFARQKAMGLVPENWRMATESPGVLAWDEVPEDKRAVMAHYMQVYAAMVDNVDHNLGRLVDELKAMGVYDNTLIVFTSDNGASSIGGPEGAANIFEKRIARQESPTLAAELFAQGALGGIDSFPAYPTGWGQASNTPFRFFKRTPMNGGIRVPCIVSWPARIPDPGAMRRQWIHVTDTLLTILEVCGQAYPAQFKGYQTRSLDGSSYAASLTDARWVATRQTQHYELEGNRGYISGTWKIASLQPPGTAIDLDHWTLFDLESDPTECDNLAERHPDILRRLIAAFEQDARANYIYPLDNRDNRRVLALPPFLEQAYTQPRTYYPGTETVAPMAVAPMLADRNFDIECRFASRTGDEGVLFAAGDNMNGLAAFVMDGQLHVAFTAGSATRRTVQLALPEGPHTLLLCHNARGQRRGDAQIALDGGPSAELDMSPTFLRLGGEGLDVGLDRKRKVSPLYAGRGVFAYTGALSWVRITPGPQAPGSFANRPEMLAQAD